MRKNISLFALLVGSALSACGAEDAAPKTDSSDDAALNAVENSPETAEAKADSIASTSTYYTVRQDLRRCISPVCGGFWVRRVNQARTTCQDGSQAAECYVADLDLARLDLDDATLSRLNDSIRAGQAVLRGSIRAGLSYGGNTLGRFGATEGYRAISSATPVGSFYRVNDLGVRCITFPCFSLHAAKLNSTVSTQLSAVSGSPDVAITASGTIFAGTIRTVPHAGPAGTGRELAYTAAYERVKRDACLTLAEDACRLNPACVLAPSGCDRPACEPDGEGGIVCHPCDPILTCRAK